MQQHKISQGRSKNNFVLQYAKLFPKHVLPRKRAKHGLMVRKGYAEHFRSFATALFWKEHGEEIAVNHWQRLLQSAQDKRFREKERGWPSLEDLRHRQDKKTAAGLKRECDLKVREARLEKRKLRRAQWEFNRKLSEDRKAAYSERDAWMADWKKRHAQVLPNRTYHRRKERERKRLLKERTSEKGVWALITRIQTQPCYCYWCNRFLREGGEADHVVPLAKGGTNSLHNIVPSCVECNRVKRDIMPDSPLFPVSNQLQIALVA